MNSDEQWINVDGTVLDVRPDGSGVTYRPTSRSGWGGRRGGEGYVSPENMQIVRSSPFWKRASVDVPCPHDPTGTSPYACACEDG